MTLSSPATVEQPAPPKSKSWITSSWIVLAIIAAGALAYMNGLHGEFVVDDVTYIRNNPNVRSLWPIWHAMHAPPESGIGGRPLVSLSYAINYAIGGLDPFNYHVTNVVLHIINTLL